MIYRIEIEVAAPVNPTEDPDLVEAAITELFPTATVESRDGELVGRAHSIDRFAELLAKQRILDTARSRLNDAIVGDTIRFRLKKQAARAGVINFALDGPDELGDLRVTIDIEQPSPAELVDAMTAPGGLAG